MNPGEQFFRLGDMLVQRGALTVKKLQRGLQLSHESRRRLGDVLVSLGYVTEADVAHCLADQYGFPYNDLKSAEPTPEALARLDAEFALKWGVLPIADEARFSCAISDPLNVELSDAISAIARKPVSFSIACRTELIEAIRRAYGMPEAKAKPEKNRRKRLPVPESVLQKDRAMLLASITAELQVEHHGLRRAG